MRALRHGTAYVVQSFRSLASPLAVPHARLFRGSCSTSADPARAMSTKAESILFYDITPPPGGCPFAQRAWIALEEKQLPYDHRLVDPANKPKEFLELYASIVHNTQDSAKVPVLVDPDGDKVTESLIALEWLDAKYPDAGVGRLLPEDPLQLANVKLFIELFTSKFQAYWFKILRAGDVEEVTTLAKELEVNLQALDDYIKLSGNNEGGSYLLGGRYSAAETATTSFLRRALLTLPYFKHVSIEEILKSKGLNRLNDWIQAALDRPSNKATGLSDEQIIKSSERFVQQPIPDDFHYPPKAA